MGPYYVRNERTGDVETVEILSDRITITRRGPDGGDLVETHPLALVSEWGGGTRIISHSVLVEFIDEETGFGTSYTWKGKGTRQMLTELESRLGRIG